MINARTSARKRTRLSAVKHGHAQPPGAAGSESSSQSHSAIITASRAEYTEPAAMASVGCEGYTEVNRRE